MRVLMLSWEYPPVIAGGLARHVAGLSRALVAQGVEVHVLTRGRPSRERVAGVWVHRVAGDEFPFELDAFLEWVASLDAAIARRGRELCDELDFDLVHGHDWLVAQAGRAIGAAVGLPWVVTVHATEHGRHSGRVGAQPQSAIHAAERAMAGGAERVIACSEWMAGHVVEALGVPAARVTTVPNGIDAAAVATPADEVVEARRRELVGDGDGLVLLAGRLVHEKGFHRGLEAIAALRERRPGVRFAVAGDGPARAELRALAHTLDLDRSGTFMGWCDDAALATLYRAADVLAVPSLFEPFGLVVLEAMACGCPCVVSDTGGPAEVVGDGDGDGDGDGGLAGVRVAVDDAAALAAALDRLLGDEALRTSIAAAGRARVRRFGWPAVATATRDVYTRALSDAATG